MKSILKALITIGVVMNAGQSYAWEANYQLGPLQIMDPIDNAAVKANALSSNPLPSAAGLFETRTIAYPSEDGLGVGDGWDFINNEKRLGACVDFTLGDDSKYQNSELNVQDILDDETLSVALNASFSGSVGGTIEIIKANASASLSIDAFHKVSTSDVSFTAHASVTSGVKYTAPSNSGFVSLKSDMVRLAQRDPEAFRKRCGDGFASSIGYGADLYLLLTFHHLNSEDRATLTHEADASAGFGDVFSAKGSSRLSTTITKLADEKKLDINFVQRGGKIGTLPLTLEEARTKISTLTTEERDGPRGIFVKVTPYDELSNWPVFKLVTTGDYRLKAVRYSQRLASLYYEGLNVRNEAMRSRTGAGSLISDDNYLSDYRHDLRIEDVNTILDEIWKRLAKVDELLSVLNGSGCLPEALTQEVTPGPQRYREKEEEIRKRHKGCQEKISKLVSETGNFDDLEFAIRFPNPVNAFTNVELSQIVGGFAGIDDRKLIFAKATFRHRIERADQSRCRLFMECLSSDRRQALFDKIRLSLDGNGDPKSKAESAEKFSFCMGEKIRICNSPRVYRDCDFAQQNSNAVELAAKQTCEVDRPGYTHSVTDLGSRGGNRCGYTTATITCYLKGPKVP